MSRWIPLFAVLLLGCPKDPPPVTSGAVVDDRPAWVGLDRSDLVRHRRAIDRKLAVLEGMEGPAVDASRRRLQAGRALLDALSQPSAAAPRDQERAALKAWSDYFDAQLAAESTPHSSTVDLPDGPPPGPIAQALQQADAGAIEEAIALADDARDDLALAGADSLTLLIAMAEWSLAADRPEIARQLLTEATRLSEDVVADIEAIDGLLAAAEEAELGPGQAGLLEARRLVEDGDWLGAEEAYLAVIELGSADQEHVESMYAADEELRELATTLEGRSLELLARVDVLLAGDPPYDAAAALLEEVEGFPERTVDDGELLRLRAWHRSLTSEEDRARVEAEQEELEDRLQAARDLVAAGQYRDAVAAFRSLEGTPLQARARTESRAAIDELVRADRERAGRLFVAARKKSGEARTAALQEVRALLQGLLNEFPTSSYAGRVADNLAAVDRELEK